MKYLVIDTETTGIFDFKQPADAPGQPRMASAHFIHVDADGDAFDRQNFLIRPDGWTMPAEASAVNGLTTELLVEQGVPVARALDAYEAAIEAGYVVVAFNAQFDCKVLRAELRRAGRPDRFETTRNICVMRPLVDVMKPPHPRNPSWYKFPKLSEALEYIGATNDAPHRASGDADGDHAVFRWLLTQGLLPAAAVHFAKERAA